MITRRNLLLGGTAAAATFGIWARSTASSADTELVSRAAPGNGRVTPTTARVGTIAPRAPVATSPATSTVPPLDHDLVEGMSGDEVRRLQQRLIDVAFDPGPIDGVFGPGTLRSVWAFEKLVLGVPRQEMRGVITPMAWERLHEPVEVVPRRAPGGTHMEVYLPEQVSALFVDGRPRVISHVSSGEGITWCDEVEIDLDDGTTEVKGICGKSVTPGGVYHFNRKVDGWRNAKLGRLYQPIYFNYGIAIHGSGDVPAFPASRGCVRHPMHIAEYLPDLIELGDHIFVFDGVEEPETYGPQPMIFDWPDPDWVPPSTTSTTTTTGPTTATSSTTTTTTTTTTTHAPHSTTTTGPTTTTTATTTTQPPTTSTSPPPTG